MKIYCQPEFDKWCNVLFKSTTDISKQNHLYQHHPESQPSVVLRTKIIYLYISGFVVIFKLTVYRHQFNLLFKNFSTEHILNLYLHSHFPLWYTAYFHTVLNIFLLTHQIDLSKNATLSREDLLNICFSSLSTNHVL